MDGLLEVLRHACGIVRGADLTYATRGMNRTVGNRGDARSAASPGSTWGVTSALFWSGLIVVLGGMAYANSFSGVFLFDDHVWILEDLSIRSLKRCMLYSSRPLVGLSLWLNYRLGGLNPADYHAFNVCVHLLNGLLLFGVLRRTLRLPSVAVSARHAATSIAGLAAALWVVHPLQTECVTYVVQRAELLMGLFALLTMYAYVRSVGAPRPDRWQTLSVVACALGMAAKPVMVVIPIVLWLYHRTFVQVSRSDQSPRTFFALLASTWIVPAVLLSVPNESSTTTGLAAGLITPWHYFLTQQGILLHYVRLIALPDQLCLDYAWPAVWPLWKGLPFLALHITLLAAIVLSLRRGRSLAFAGAWFYLLLLPTSSFLPVADYAVEHRLYLALAGAALVVAVGLHRAGGCLTSRRFGGAIVAILTTVALLSLGVRTWRRNQAYHSRVRMASSIVRLRPTNFRWHTTLVSALLDEGRTAEAEIAARRFVRQVTATATEQAARSSSYPLTRSGHAAAYEAVAQYQWGRALLAGGDLSAAAKAFGRTLELDPRDQTAWHHLGLVSWARGQRAAAEAAWARTLDLDRTHPDALTMLGLMKTDDGRWAEAAAHFRRCLSWHPDAIAARSGLAWLLATCPDEEVRDGVQALRLAVMVHEQAGEQSVRGRDLLAAALAENGRFSEAVAAVRDALEVARQRDTPLPDGLTPTVREELERDWTLLLEAMRSRRALYQRGKPFRLEARAGNEVR